MSGDGRLAVAAYGDGTIRWHRMDDGRELLALYVLANRRDWVAWTPEGFYDATPGAEKVLKWRVNRGPDAAAFTLPVSAIPQLKRPGALPFVLRELETVRALGLDDLKLARIEVQRKTGAVIRPGAQLHVLAIGLSDYDKAKFLHLDFAAQDAKDIAKALERQDAKQDGYYAKVSSVLLPDALAKKTQILRALGAIKANMQKGEGKDLAVIFYSGHGAVIGNQFYLFPNDVDLTTDVDIKATALSARDFRDEVADLAAFGRVLVLLDACHAGGVASADADVLLNSVNAGNITVLASSRKKEPSREADGHGFFTKALLEALDGKSDHDPNGAVSTPQLTHYVMTRVPELTRDKQHPDKRENFDSPIFFVPGR
jgi:hypothetical protein